MQPTRSPVAFQTASISLFLSLAAPLAGQNWSQVPTAHAPSPRNSAGCAFDIARGMFVQFGGWDLSHLGDTWEYDGLDWQQRSPAHAPVPRSLPRMVYDPHRMRTILYGGHVPGIGWTSETWEWDGNDWTQLHPMHTPRALGYGSMAFDSVRRRITLFGGSDNLDVCFGETYEWDGIDWIQLQPAQSPSARRDAAITFDSVRGHMVLFGGGDNNGSVFADTWTWDGSNWTLLTPPTSPGARWGMHMVFDALSAKAVFYGGADATSTVNYGDTWTWDGTAWAQAGTGPSPRRGGGMVYDAQRGTVVMQGGMDGAGFYSDTWEWNGRGAILRVPTQFPSIQAAIQAAGNGDRIEVAAGTYNEVINLLGKDLTVVGVAGPQSVTIDGSGFQDAVVTANSGEPPTACVRGFTLTGGTGKPFPSSYGFDYYGGGAYVGGSGSSLQLHDCWILGNATSTGTFGGGVCVRANCRAELRRCLIAGNRAWASGGATLVDGTGSTMLLERCTVANNSANAWAFGHQGGISMANGGGVDIVNCIVWGNSGSQIRAFGAPYNAGTWANCNFSCVEGGIAGVGNIAGDPQFANPAISDYRLQPTSPCINSGDPASQPDPDNTIADMGAFWFPMTSLAQFTAFGTGCAGSAGTPTLSAASGSLPRLGQALDIDLSNLPNVATVAIPFYGFSNSNYGGVSLPADLAPIGMPGCTLYTDVYSTRWLLSLTGSIVWHLPIPQTATLAGLPIYLQALIADVGAGNPFGATTTNAGTATLGW